MIIRIMKMLSRIMVSPPVFHFVPIAPNLAGAYALIDANPV